MKNVQRIKVIELAKKDVIWNEISEQEQDALLEKACTELGYNFIEFWATDGNLLNSLLTE